jgi:hypothetical protein
MAASPVTYIYAATAIANARPGTRSRDPASARTLAFRCDRTRPALVCGSPRTRVRRNNPRPSSTSQRPFRYAQPRIALRSHTRNKPGFASNPCNLHRVSGLCVAVPSGGRFVRFGAIQVSLLVTRLRQDSVPCMISGHRAPGPRHRLYTFGNEKENSHSLNFPPCTQTGWPQLETIHR